MGRVSTLTMDQTKKNEKLITNITDDYYEYNCPLKYKWYGEFAIIPVLLHIVMMGVIFGNNFDNLFHSYTALTYTASLIVFAIFIDILGKKWLSERECLLLKAIINFCCFIPLSCYCAIQLYIAAIEPGQHDVLGEAVGFIYCNISFHGMQYVYLKKDFKYLQRAGIMTIKDPARLTLNDEKLISAYNIFFYSSVYAIFVVEGLVLIVFCNNGEAVEEFYKELQSDRCNSDVQTGILAIVVFIAIICVYQFIAIVKIMQGLWILCLRNPKSRNNVFQV